MPQRDELYLADILDAAYKIRTRLTDLTRERWNDDEILRDSVVYQMQIIGEAASSMSDETRAAIGDIPWRQVRAFRNIIVHHYFAIDWNRVWDTAHGDVPDLEAPVLRHLREQHPELARRFESAFQIVEQEGFPTFTGGRVITGEDVKSLEDE
jgi:uncharacterized protein with HEPN domain